MKKLNYLNQLIPFNTNEKYKKIHFIGIGGWGMGGIAKILLQLGYIVTGSDLSKNNITKNLINLGATIYFEHHKNNVKNVNTIVVSSAIKPNNPEILEGKKLNIPIILRAQMLAEIARFRYSIAISGSHGKTTTTAILVHIYKNGRLDPSFVNGGYIQSLKTCSNLGKSRYFILEADESDTSFLHLKPIVIIITNIELEHINNYCENYELLKKTFVLFLKNLPFYGTAFLCIDNKAIQEILPNINRNIQTYGFNKNADIILKNYKQKFLKSYFSITKNGSTLLNVILNLPGKHNALNATAAVLSAMKEGISNEVILSSLKNFQGVKRRFEIIKKFSFNIKKNNLQYQAILINDYGHHPNEIQATIKIVRNEWPDKKLCMIFQPHRYSRTSYLSDKFALVLSEVDELFLLKTYPADESYTNNIDKYLIYQKILKIRKILPKLIFNHKKIFNLLNSILTNDLIILVQGAGNIDIIINKIIINYFKKKSLIQ